MLFLLKLLCPSFLFIVAHRSPSIISSPTYSAKSWVRSEAVDRLIRRPWRSHTVIHIPSSGGRNVTERSSTFMRRAGRFADYTNDKWMQVDESAPPFLPSLGGLSFPLFAPSLSSSDPSGVRSRLALRGPQYPPSYDYDRPVAPPPAQDTLSRLPTNYYESPKSASSSPGSHGYGGGSGPERQRYSRPEKGPYTPYGAGGAMPPPKGRAKNGGNSGSSNYGPPPEPFYPDYEDGVPRYSYNPSETPRCAKETNVSYCIEDPEYPM